MKMLNQKSLKYTLLLLPVFLVSFTLLHVTGEDVGDDPVTGIALGNKAPNLTFPNPDGKDISLSSLHGKLVLIDFWASWCPPCRRENPNLVAVYNKYKDKEFVNGSGFTVYSVSLDKQKGSWIRAIQTDKLTWPYHVSDLKGWESVPAAMYHVTGIPSNFLVDENGVIIGRNLRGPNLENTLKKFLK